MDLFTHSYNANNNVLFEGLPNPEGEDASRSIFNEDSRDFVDDLLPSLSAAQLGRRNSLCGTYNSDDVDLLTHDYNANNNNNIVEENIVTHSFLPNDLPSELVSGEDRVANENMVKKGFLTVSPHVDLPKGKYEVFLWYASNSPESKTVGVWDIFLEKGANPHREIQKTLVQLTGTGGQVRDIVKTLTLKEDVKNVELRTFYNGTGHLAINFLQIKQLKDENEIEFKKFLESEYLKLFCLDVSIPLWEKKGKPELTTDINSENAATIFRLRALPFPESLKDLPELRSDVRLLDKIKSILDVGLLEDDDQEIDLSNPQPLFTAKAEMETDFYYDGDEDALLRKEPYIDAFVGDSDDEDDGDIDGVKVGEVLNTVVDNEPEIIIDGSGLYPNLNDGGFNPTADNSDYEYSIDGLELRLNLNYWGLYTVEDNPDYKNNNNNNNNNFSINDEDDGATFVDNEPEIIINGGQEPINWNIDDGVVVGEDSNGTLTIN